MRGPRSTKCELDGLSFDSLAEACFYCWLVEAKVIGAINDFGCQPHFPMTPTVKHSITKQLKTKTKIVERTLLQASAYTADFWVKSTIEIPGLVDTTAELPSSLAYMHYIVDVKGAFNKAASEFSLTQKMMWVLNGSYVNKVVVARDRIKYSASSCATSFFAMNGRPKRLPRECYQKCGTKLYAVWARMFDGLPSIEAVWLPRLTRDANLMADALNIC